MGGAGGPALTQTVRIAVRPAWVDVLDFETRLPGGMVRRLRAVAR